MIEKIGLALVIAGSGLTVSSTAAAAIPVVALTVWWSLRRLHHKVFKG